jgi:pyridoxal 5'-phosphate synthase pdxT subunit
MRIGILAFQGCIDPHIIKLTEIGATVVKVTSTTHLRDIEGLILPGGESSTMLKLLNFADMIPELTKFCKTFPVWGICAGAILLAKQVKNPIQQSLNAIDVNIVRNGYGSQLDSFSTKINFCDKQLPVDFIRAPIVDRVGVKVQVLANYNSNPVALQNHNVLITTFHPELKNNTYFHEYFISLINENKLRVA